MAAVTTPTDIEIQHRVDDSGVVWLTIDRPAAGNSLSAAARTQLIEALERVNDDLTVRAVVLTAVGARHFCTGADLRAPRPEPVRPAAASGTVTGTVQRGLEHPSGAQRVISAVMDCRVPVIAAVNGVAAGLGAHLVFACDVVICADHARFVEVFVRRGIVPDSAGVYLLPRLVGLQKAKELLFFGDDVPAEQARQIGLVNRVVPAADLLSETATWAARLAAAPTVSLALTKRMLNNSFETDRASSFRLEALSEEIAMTAHDGAEGVQAYVERRAPDYQGW